MLRKSALVFFVIHLLFSNAFTYGMSQPSNWAASFVDGIKNSNEIEVTRLMGNYQNSITRAEFAYMAVKLYEYYTGVATSSGTAAFSDTNDQFVLKAKNAGIVSGYPDGTYKPLNKIRRDELATLFVNLFKSAGVSYRSASGQKFADDGNIASWAKESVYIARENSIVSGVGNNNFNPAGNASIEESLIMLYKGMTQVEKVGVVQKELTATEIMKLVGPSVVLVELYDAQQNEIGVGSGFVLTDDGKIMTNFHVIEGATKAIIKFDNGVKYESNVISAYDEAIDIAIVKINATGLPTVKLGNSSMIQTGDKILTIGNPLGLENSISEGLVSSANRLISNQNFIQVSAPISPGSSGGVLLNYYGQVIGVTTAGMVEGQNLNLAVPINDAKGLMATANNITMSDLAGKVTKEKINFDNGMIYIGDVQYGEPNGEGIMTFQNGDYYIGEWKDGYFHGMGTYYWADGEKTEGTFILGDQNGYGVYTWSNGNRYEGMFKDDMFHGMGTIYYTNGETQSGEWKEGVYVSTGVKPPVVYANAISSSEILITWDQVPNADYYHLFDSNSPNGPWTVWEDGYGNKAQFAWDPSHPCRLYDIDANTTAYFKMTAVVDGVESDFSDVVYATTYNNTSSEIEGPLLLYSDETKRVFLGDLTSNKYDSDGVFNQYGSYGSKYSSTSIWNEYGKYGSAYSTYSAFNEYAMNPPLIVDGNGYVVGRLTINKYTAGGVSPYDILPLLIDLGL